MAKRKLARGTLYSISSKIIYLICGYAIYVLIGRILGPSQYGIIGVVFSSLNFSHIFLKNGVPQATVKYIGGDKTSAYPVMSTAMRIQLPWAIILFLLVFGGAEVISLRVLKDIELTPYIRLASVTIIPLAFYTIYESTLIGVRNFSKSALGMAFTSVMRLVLVSTFLVLGMAVNGVFIGYICAAILGVIIVRSFCSFDKSSSRFDSKKILSFALPLVITGGMVTLLLNIDSILVKRIMGNDTQVGFYFSAATIAHALYQMAGPFGVTLLPSIAHSYKRNDYELTRKYVRQVFRYILIISMPVAAIVSATSSELVTLIYGDTFYPAGLPLSILIFGSLFFGLSTALNTSISAIDHPWIATIFYLFPAILIVPLSLSWISKYGLVGASAAISCAYVVSLMGSLIYLQVKLGGLIDWISLGRILFAGVITYFVGFALPISGPVLVVYYILLFLVNGIILILLGEWHREDYEVLKGILGQETKMTG